MNTPQEITPTQLSKWLETNKKITILDIRPLAERTEWFIPTSIHSNSYNQLKAGDATALDDLELDKTIPVITLCAGGKLSLFATEILAAKGFEAYSLQGGMKAWNVMNF